jgi:hypothetical protein
MVPVYICTFIDLLSYLSIRLCCLDDVSILTSEEIGRRRHPESEGKSIEGPRR